MPTRRVEGQPSCSVNPTSSTACQPRPLRERALIQGWGRGIVIRDVAALEATANFDRAYLHRTGSAGLTGSCSRSAPAGRLA
ncbi:hypothetical protein [Methylobacterium frigidaeris]|nr:hypothetical protein [Methylobacterium frigidaeris]